MYCVKYNQTIEDTIKKSRFIGAIVPCWDEHEIMLSLKSISQEHPNATHIAFAYRLKTEHGLTYRFHDAGEPAGTAGKPIFQHLEGKDLVNVLIAVIRYFGGIKLGAGGLTRAYGNTAKKVIEAADIIPYVEMVKISLTIEYAQIQLLEYTLKKLNGTIVDQEFSGQVRLSIELPAKNLNALLASFPGSPA